MGQDWYTGRFRHGKLVPFPRKIAEEIFEPGALYGKSIADGITYPDGPTELRVQDGDELTGIGFGRCGSETFLERLFELIDVTGSVLFWPGDETWAVFTDPALREHFPKDAMFLENPPVLVRTLDEMKSVAGFI